MRFVQILAATSGLLVGSFAIAQTAAQGVPGQRISLSIEAQPLRTALREFESQSGLQVSYREEDVETTGVMAPRVAGELEAEEALRLLLSGTGLKFEFINPRLVRLSSAAENATESKVAEGEKPTAMVEKQQSRKIRLAQASAQEAEYDSILNARTGESQYQNERGVPEILVKGARALNMDIRRTEDDAQPYVVFDRQVIEKSGARTIEEFLNQRLTANTSFAANNQNQSFFGNTSRINLRGLGTDETLILIDGRRTVGFVFGGQPEQADINGIPLAAVERIEVLPSTASGIYGGGATGGVINIVMRRDYSGVETNVSYGNTFGADASAWRVDVTSGFQFQNGRTNLLLTGSYAESDDLRVRDRDFIQRARQHLMEVNPDALIGPVPPLSSTTNIVSATGENLTLKPAFGGASLNSRFTHIPAGYAGVASDNGAALVANAGTYNLDLAPTAQAEGARQSLLAGPTIRSAGMTLRHQLTPRIDAFAEVHVSENAVSVDSNPGNLFASLSASDPANPFNQPINIVTPALGLDMVLDSELENTRAVVGLIAQLPGDWRGGLDFTWNRSTFEGSSAAIDLVGHAGPISSGEIDVFRDTREFPVDFTPFLLDPTVNLPARTTLKDIFLRASGKLGLALPAGAPALSMLVEHRDEDSAASGQRRQDTPTLWVETLTFPRSQSVDSVYLELLLPLIAGRGTAADGPMFELQLAGRHDRYETDGANSISIRNGVPSGPEVRVRNAFSSTDPTIGLRFVPIQDVMFRASYGTGFLPPGVHQLTPSTILTPVSSTIASRLRDPARGNEPLSAYSMRTLGNPGLRPEESESWSAGFVLTPRALPGLRVSVDWTQIHKRDNITQLSGLTQSSIDAFVQFAPERVTRAAPEPGDPFGVGRITQIDATLINFESTDVEAYDFGVSYEAEAGPWGRFSFSGKASHLARLGTQITQTSPIDENAGVLGNVKWRANASLHWEYGPLSLGWTTRYFGSYWLNRNHAVNASQGSATVPSQIYHDFIAGYTFDTTADHRFDLLSGVHVQLIVNNVFDKRPPLDMTVLQRYYSTLGDPRLANYTLAIRKSF